MKLLQKYVIPLDPRTKKNTHRIAGKGPRCPLCGKHERQFVRNGSTTTDFAFRAVQYLRPKPEKPIAGRVRVVYRIYTGTRRRVDDLNLYANLDDILTDGRILADDNRDIIRSRDGSRVDYDKVSPRAEIYIYEYEEGEDPYAVWDEDVHL